ncbi:MAG: hypothetical protein ACE5I5_10370 [Candidatus Heimdallarchaeota archaeon]
MKQPYFQCLENIVKEICAQAEPDKFKDYLIEVTCLEFLGIKVEMSIRVREDHSSDEKKVAKFGLRLENLLTFKHWLLNITSDRNTSDENRLK